MTDPDVSGTQPAGPPASSRPKAHQEDVWRSFFINISLVLCLFVIGVFMGLILRTNTLIHEQVLAQARSHINSITLTRRWNSDYGGVYVKKTAGVVSNPYLENPDIQSTAGDTYTKKNPALMTREISEYAEKAGSFRFHITSLRPINPGNKPTEFEAIALAAFEKGEKEVSETKDTDKGTIFTYMAPLYVEKGCLACHAKQGYQVGDVRGGISVTIDVTEVQKNININKYVIIGLSIFSVFFLLGAVYWHITRLARKLTKAYETIERMSVTDELTQIYNRRFFHTRLSQEISRSKRYKHFISLILLDLDHFKKVNDVYGHQAGDIILKGVADTLKAHARITDVVARYGGEELVVLLPETNQVGATSFAEKLRALVEAQEFALPDGRKIKVTASLGVSTLTPDLITGMSDYDAIIKYADDALYIAKRSGRNRVETKLCYSEADNQPVAAAE